VGAGWRLIPRSSRLNIAAELAAWLIGARRWVRVRGDSMEPTLSGGDLVLVDADQGRPQVGAIVVAADPERPGQALVKRVGSRGDDSVALMSDNPTEARDSRHFGSISLDHLRGAATVVFKNDGAMRLVSPA
jgi:nickel-type superoxide dismutase maturation protease